MKTAVFPVLFLALIWMGFAVKDPAREKLTLQVKQVNTYFSTLKSFEMAMDYSVYRKDATVPMEKTKSTTAKSGKFHFAQDLGAFQIVQNEELRLMKDDSNKVIVLAPPTEMKEANSKVNVDKALRVAKTINITSDNAEVLSAVFTFEKNPALDYHAMEISIDKKRKVLSKITIHYLPKLEFSYDGKTPLQGRLEMDLKSFQPNQNIAQNQFSVNRYIRKNAKGKWMLQDAFKEYQLIDQTQNAQ